MATIVRGTIPAAELALNHTLAELSGIEIECERVVKSGEDSVMPLLWIRDCDRPVVDAALETDPSVESVSCLSEFESEYLYEMAWVDHVELLLQMITNGQATILDMYGRGDCWQLRVLYPGRDHLSTTHEFADEHGLTFDIESIRDLSGDPAGRYGLTDGQYRTLVEAARRGYFEVPREVALEDLAAEFDVTHQSLSEQIRRATGTLVEDALMIGSVPDQSY